MEKGYGIWHRSGHYGFERYGSVYLILYLFESEGFMEYVFISFKTRMRRED